MVRSPLPYSVAAAILSGEIVQLHLQFRFQAVIGSGECIGELLGSARTEDDRRDRRVRQNPSDRQFRQRLASLAGELAQLADRLKLSLMPVAIPICGAELSDLH